jgi:hypothetical protein
MSTEAEAGNGSRNTKGQHPSAHRQCCAESTGGSVVNGLIAVNSDPHTARRAYMREYMRRRRAAARDAKSKDDVKADKGMTREFQKLSPTIQAAVTIDEIDRAELDFKYEALDLGELCDQFVKGLKRFHYGDIRGIENGLLCQARTLDRIFYLFVRRACREGSAEYRDLEFRIAFRAQSHYRANLATLAAIKNPARVAFVSQANIANGPQQVNNARTVRNGSRRKIKNRPNKQSGRKRELLPNPRASAAKGTVDSQMEAMGTFHGTKDP